MGGGQPARDFIGRPFPIGTLQPISGLIQLKSLDLSYCEELTGTALFGNNQLAISLADLQVHLNRWRGSANYRSSFSRTPDLLVSQNPKVVRAQPTAIFIRSPFPIGTLDPISGLVELKQLNLHMCRNLTGTFGCGETTRELIHWLICRFT